VVRDTNRVKAPGVEHRPYAAQYHNPRAASDGEDGGRQKGALSLEEIAEAAAGGGGGGAGGGGGGGGFVPREEDSAEYKRLMVEQGVTGWGSASLIQSTHS
jgi:hypothetical protein